MSAFHIVAAVLLSIFLLKLASVWTRRRMLKSHMPPSPPGLPLLGNVLQVPLGEAWRTFAQWKAQFGPIFSLDMAGKPMIVLNTLEAATDLLDRRSSIYSDRPRLITAGEIICRDSNVGFIRYGMKWRKMRRVTHDIMHVRAVHAFEQHQEHDAAILVAHLLESPDKWDPHFRHAASSSAYSVTYGEHLSSKESYAVVERNFEFVHIMATASLPVTAPYVEIFPFLLYVPEWFPGAKWKRVAFDHQRRLTAMFKGYLDDIKVKVQNGTARSCLAAQLIEQQGKYGLTEVQDIWLAGIVYITGAETTGGALFTFLLAMVLFPEVLKRAQTEVDQVVGRDRMPTFEDQKNLRYIQAMVKEVQRWFPGVPLGLPRQCMEDDWYGEYLIPQGTTILPNIWAMSRDPQYFPDPERFMPERFLDGDKEKSKAMAAALEMNFPFGFGRRICLGKNYASRTLFIMLATLVWAFDISKAKDEAGNEITPSRTACIDDGLVVRPAPFPCEIRPRHYMVHKIVEGARKCSDESR
ncbi:hypothetical protein NM688_g678 [Phlebia brevispora]|uniref:Uncharacterized protein n=1 Tax=Phlebia brevispora TaxID=194682 RepID=A0ACC1TDI8_9APHY|nr:hypothetical protein NM688_g678 [Phlebia brevispora]